MDAKKVKVFAPYRVSFVGGGTDLPEFYMHNQGAVLSTTIDSGVTVTIEPNTQSNIRVSTDKVRIYPDIDSIENDLIRESLKWMAYTKPLNISIQADLPPGTGMGSSGTLAVCLLAALSQLGTKELTLSEIAESAFFIERNILGCKVGKQDQYAAAFGGINLITFQKNDVIVEPLNISKNCLLQLEQSCLLLATGGTRRAKYLLNSMATNMQSKLAVLQEMRDLTLTLADILKNSELDISSFGDILERNWKLKKGLSPGISVPHTDTMHSQAMGAGASGAKLLGAGSAGYLLVLAEKSRHSEVRRRTEHSSEIPFVYRHSGLQIINSNTERRRVALEGTTN